MSEIDDLRIIAVLEEERDTLIEQLKESQRQLQIRDDALTKVIVAYNIAAAHSSYSIKVKHIDDAIKIIESIGIQDRSSST